MNSRVLRTAKFALLALTFFFGGRLAAGQTGINKINHIVFIVKENHTFDSMFGTYEPPPYGTNNNGTNLALMSTGAWVPMGEAPDAIPSFYCHDWTCLISMMDNGKMDHYDQTYTCLQNGVYMCLYQYHQSDLPNYWQYATNFVLGDNVFASMHTTTFPNHLVTIAASSGGIIDYEDHLGCAAVEGSVATFMDQYGNTTKQFPCIDITTMADLLIAAGYTWKSYAPAQTAFSGYAAINHIYNSPQWNNVVEYSEFPNDALKGHLANVSWLIANNESEYPPFSLCDGENWTVNQINAIMQGPDWNDTAIFLIWNDPGGWYDHVPPPVEDQFGLAQRVPFLIISPYAIPGYISHTLYEPSSVLKFIEERFNLPSLGGRDQNANDMQDSFNWNQTPNQPLVLSTRTCPMVQSSQTFQSQAVNTTSPTYNFTYVNDNTTTLSDFIQSVTISPSNGPFTQQNNCTVVYPAAYCTISSTFKPTTTGTQSATITITDKLGQNGQLATHTISLSGIGTDVSISPTGIITFPATPLGSTSAPKTITLTNLGTTAISVSNVNLSGAGFNLQSNTCTPSIPANGQCSLTVTFTPQSGGALPATLTVTDSDPSSPQVITLTGGGSTLSISPSTLNFGNVPLFITSAPQTETITNVSASNVALTSISFGGLYDWADFTQTNTCPSTLAPKGTCTVQITFTPTFEGPVQGTFEDDITNPELLVSYPAKDSPLVVPMSGTGIASTNHPAPNILSLVPRTATPGTKAFTLSVYGTGFSTSSVINWNGTPLATKVNSGRYLQATVLGSQVTPGTIAVTVTTPTPGGGWSNMMPFTVVQPETSVNFTTSSVAVGKNPQGIVTADFNGDRILDLAVSDEGSGEISVLYGVGNGTFNAQTPIGTSGYLPGPLVTADFNNDGIPDLAAGTTTPTTAKVEIFLGNGTPGKPNGTFTPVGPGPDCQLLDDCGNTVDPVSLATSDFLSDGYVGVAVVNNAINTLTLMEGQGNGTTRALSTVPQTNVSSPQQVVFSDFNNDGVPDFAMVNATNGAIDIQTGKGNGTFKPQTSLLVTDAVGLVTGDFNGDGFQDIAVISNSGSTVTIFLGNGNGTFQTGVAYATGTGPTAIIAADFNGDGILDLATANSSGTVSVLLGTGTGTFPTHTEYTVGGTPSALVAGDFTGDGRIDIAVSNSTGNSITLFEQ